MNFVIIQYDYKIQHYYKIIHIIIIFITKRKY